MKFENTEVWGFKHAIRGMRNPKNSWHLSDSDETTIGPKDLKLMQTLICSGSEHRKFMRQILVSVDITAPLYWWKEFDTYKVGTTANSTSTMHKLTANLITKECFEMDDFNGELAIDRREDALIDYFTPHWHIEMLWDTLIEHLEDLRQMVLKTEEPAAKAAIWKELVRMLPEAWLQKRTVTLDYENVFSMIHQRKNHKLREWREDFIAWTKSLPYANELLYIGVNNENITATSTGDGGKDN